MTCILTTFHSSRIFGKAVLTQLCLCNRKGLLSLMSLIIVVNVVNRVVNNVINVINKGKL